MKTPLSMRLMGSIIKHRQRPCINQVTYGQIQDLSNNYDNILTRLGVQPNDRIGIFCSKKSPHQVAMMLAGWQKSAIIVPLPDDPPPSILPLVRPRVVLNSDMQITVPEKQDDMMMKAPSFTQSQIEDDRPALILFTSGSTNEPKGVVLTHHNIIQNLDMIGNLYQEKDLSCHDVSFSILPWYHCYGLVCELLFLMTRGAHIHVPYNPKNPMPEMKWIRPTLLFTVPKMLERLYKSEWNAILPPSIIRNLVWGNRLRMMSVGGSHCPTHIVDFFQERYHTPIYEGYGMTEFSPMIALNSPGSNKYMIGSVGKPLNGVEIRIEKETGQILARSPSLMKGYLSSIDPLTRQILMHPLNLVEGSWFPTGDKGYIDAQGFLYVKGRLKSEYKLSNGKYVNPEYIESWILRSKIIEQALVMADPKTKDGNICLVISNSRDTQQLLQEIQLQCTKGGVSSYEIPNSVYILKEPFSVHNGLLSMKMDPKRLEIESRWTKNELECF